MKPWWVRAFLWVFSRVLYRVRALQPDRLPETGGALLVSNHVSLVDMLLILSSTRRFVRFLIPEDVCARPILRRLLPRLKVMPLPAADRPADLARTLARATELIRNGEVVGIFAERTISRIGVLQPFRGEFEQIMEKVDAPIVPVCLDGVWGSIFSYQAGRFFWKIPQRIPYPVTISFGEPLPASAKAPEVRARVQALATEAWTHRRTLMQPLGRAFVASVRRHPFRFAMADARTPGITFGGALVKTIFLGRRLRRYWAGQEMVGVLLPSSIAGALVNFAALLAGKIPVNLNYTLSADAVASCARQCQLQSIVTSKLFLSRVKIALPCPVLALEEVAAAPRAGEKLAALALAWLSPCGWLEKSLGATRVPTLDDTATVIFSSGSTGDPKGVVLSHYNVVSNVAQIEQLFDFGPKHRFLGILPFFHSFGFTATLMEPMLSGFGVVYHPDPREGKAVGDLVKRFGVTTLMATPSLLRIYHRMCESAQFRSLTFVMTGAEKLPHTLAAEFQAKFGILPVEGYGCTECSPVVAANRLDFRGPHLVQQGTVQGTIGLPLPAVSIRIVEPDTGQPVPLGTTGLLVVKGPNVMQGYLGQPALTAACLRDGWYDTGDLALEREDGFLEIKGRKKRFAKIAGEMVPLDGVQDALNELAGAQERQIVVTALPDEARGERLVALHLLEEPALAGLLGRLPQLNLPNLWKPKADQFFRIEKIPLTGPDKIDYRRISELASGLSKAPAPSQPATLQPAGSA